MTERTSVRRFNTTNLGPSGSSPPLFPTKVGSAGGAVGRGTLKLVRGVAVGRRDLEREVATLVGVTVGIEEEVVAMEVEVGGRLGDGMGLEVEEYVSTIVDKSGVDSTDSVAFPFQTN